MKTNNPESEAGLYFFTIYTHRQETRLGRITRRGMRANALGRTTEAHWHNLSRVFPNIRLDAWKQVHDECNLHDTAALEETQAFIMTAPTRWQDDRRQRLNPVSRQKTGYSLNWLLPSFLAAEV